MSELSDLSSAVHGTWGEGYLLQVIIVA